MDAEYQIDQPNKGLSRIVWLVLGLLIAAFFVTAVYYFTKVNKPATSESHEVHFVVDRGMNTREIATKLNLEKIISSKWVFDVYITLHRAGNKIQAGEYQLNSNMAISEIVDVLTHGRVVSTARNITIIEGLTNKQIDDYLVSRQISKPGEFSKSADDKQGYLFPDTYQLGKNETASDLVSKMFANFKSKTTQLNPSSDQVIMASIIEKEVGRTKPTLTDDDLAAMQKERELVASVFYNRIKVGMALESDATVNYITGKADRSVSIADTKIKSPYNTYQVRGLPPMPISNPGLGSITAAVNPAKSDYLFFLNAPDGTAYFAKTLAEHNANRARYLK